MSSIPNKLHFIWVGTQLPKGNAVTLLRWAEQNPLYQVYFWLETKSMFYHMQTVTDSFRDMSLHKNTRTGAQNHIQGKVVFFRRDNAPDFSINFFSISSIPCLSDPMLVQEEMDLWKNYGAASDIFRLWVVYEEGGIYMDFDTEPIGKKLPVDIIPPKTMLFGDSEIMNNPGLGNHIIATIAKNTYIKWLIESIERNYETEMATVGVRSGIRTITESATYRFKQIDGIRERIATRKRTGESTSALKSSLRYCMNPVLLRSGPWFLVHWLSSLEGTDVDTGISVSFEMRDKDIEYEGYYDDEDKYTEGEVVKLKNGATPFRVGRKFDPVIEALYSFQRQTGYHPKLTWHGSWIK